MERAFSPFDCDSLIRGRVIDGNGADQTGRDARGYTRVRIGVGVGCHDGIVNVIVNSIVAAGASVARELLTTSTI